MFQKEEKKEGDESEPFSMKKFRVTVEASERTYDLLQQLKTAQEGASASILSNLMNKGQKPVQVVSHQD